MTVAQQVIDLLASQGIKAEETVKGKVIVPDLPRANSTKQLAPKVMELNQLFITHGLRDKAKAASGGKHGDDPLKIECWILILMGFEKPAKASY